MAPHRRGADGAVGGAEPGRPEPDLACGEAEDEEESAANTKTRPMGRCRGRRGTRHGGERLVMPVLAPASNSGREGVTKRGENVRRGSPPCGEASGQLVGDEKATAREIDGGGSDADVDRRAALYISRVQERLRRERVADDWRKYY